MKMNFATRINADVIDNPLQPDDRPYLGSTVYFIHNGKLIEGGLIDVGSIESELMICGKDDKQYYSIDINRISLYKPGEPAKIGFSQRSLINGNVEWLPVKRAGESFEEKWKRILNLTQPKTL